MERSTARFYLARSCRYALACHRSLALHSPPTTHSPLTPSLALACSSRLLRDWPRRVFVRMSDHTFAFASADARVKRKF